MKSKFWFYKKNAFFSNFYKKELKVLLKSFSKLPIEEFIKIGSWATYYRRTFSSYLKKFEKSAFFKSHLWCRRSNKLLKEFFAWSSLWCVKRWVKSMTRQTVGLWRVKRWVKRLVLKWQGCQRKVQDWAFFEPKCVQKLKIQSCQKRSETQDKCVTSPRAS